MTHEISLLSHSLSLSPSLFQLRDDEFKIIIKLLREKKTNKSKSKKKRSFIATGSSFFDLKRSHFIVCREKRGGKAENWKWICSNLISHAGFGVTLLVDLCFYI